MNMRLSHIHGKIAGAVEITGSKSESNRLLILQALFPGIHIENLSNSDDTRVLSRALASEEELVDVHHAGTAMRFLTAYYSQQEDREVLLTGSPRMQERPVGVLVEALRQLGADITYAGKQGYPPLRIRGKRLPGQKVRVRADISSQYISALMLIAPALPAGLEILLEGKATSVPYIQMTLNLMKNCGFTGSYKNQVIRISPSSKAAGMQRVESDWSSASYYYSIVALAASAELRLSSYRKHSQQGDRVVAEIFSRLGVQTQFREQELLLSKKKVSLPENLELDLSDAPDIAQTIAVTCLGLEVPCRLNGLHTLKIKETDRLQALKNEIEKLGGRVEIDEDSLRLTPAPGLHKKRCISTYKDHRMALSFAPLALKVPLEIEDSGVVSKSYPGFWEDLEQLDFSTIPAGS